MKTKKLDLGTKYLKIKAIVFREGPDGKKVLVLRYVEKKSDDDESISRSRKKITDEAAIDKILLDSEDGDALLVSAYEELKKENPGTIVQE